MTTRLTIPQLLESPAQWAGFVGDLRQGAVAALPTDTLYGLAVDGDCHAGIEAVYELKGREAHKPLILFLPGIDRLATLGIVPTPTQRRILERFWPGQLTAVFPVSPSPLAGFGFPTLGIRVPDHPELLRFLAEYPGHLLTTSSNPSGSAPLADPDEIERAFSPRLGWLLDGGRLAPSAPSTVLDLSVSPPRLLREGRISRAELAAAGAFEAP